MTERIRERVKPQLPSQQSLSLARSATSQRYLLGLMALALVYVGLAFFFSQVMPFNKGPDEGINLDYIEFINARERLPITYAERDEVGPKANWPALYHLSVVGLGKLLGFDLSSPPHLKIFWDSFRYRAIDLQDDEVWHLPTEDQVMPYYGPILALHLGRWLSIFFSLITLCLVYFTMQEIFPEQPWLGFVAAALLAFTPQFIFVGSALNEDALVAALAALYFWLLARLFKQPQNLWLYGVLGLTLGLSITAKYTTVVLPLEVSVVFALLARRHGYSWPWWGQRLALVGVSAIVASSWWFGWNFWYLNEIKELGVLPGLLRPLFTGGTDVTLARLGNFLSGGQIGLTGLPENTNVGTFPEWGWITFLSFWGVSIGGFVPWYPYIYIGVGLLIGGAVFGLMRLWRMSPASRQWLLLMAGHIAIFLILPLIRFTLSRRLGQTAQGRHILIPAAAAIVGLLVWGVATVVPPRWQRWVFGLLIIGFVGWTAAHLYRLDTYAAPLLPLRTLPQAAEWLSRPARVQFGETLELVSYEIEPQPEPGQLRLQLAWRSLAYMNENYLLKVSLLDRQGQVVSHWLGYNGQGRLPTLAWDPGDVVFDRLALPLPNLPAGDYKVQVQLISQAGPLPVSGQGQVSTTSLELTEISLAEVSRLVLPERMSLADSDPLAFALWQTDGPTETTYPPNYRYPATISVVVEPDAVTHLYLVDETGREWPANQAEANIFTFVIGPRWPSGPYQLKAVVESEGRAATTEPVLTVENWWPRNFEIPPISTPQEANFANQLKFLGYKLDQNWVKAGEALPLTLYWQAPPGRSPQADFMQFNHFLDNQGTLHGGYDRRPLEYYSTLLWSPGEVVIDGYSVPVAADAPPGPYYLNVGYYLIIGESAVNLPLVVNGQMSSVTTITIGPIEVIE
ncbi:MAG: hypothetical protein DPW09_32690 [Anaerolineae bacterium]|nr:glycosyltransferase family 39 protein [Anaerolineales bacterium]MCQ3978209.1 hypothetical protein [Anaerolineae bacterium]